MLKGFTENGEVKNVKVTDDGAIVVQAGVQQGEGNDNTIIVGNTSESPVPVQGNVDINNNETTLHAGVMTVGTTETTIGVNKKVTQISIANYSEEANVTVSVDAKNYVIGSNIATDLAINKNVGTVGISAAVADTKVQYVIKGEE